MPLYDYGCRTCGPFREWRSMSEWEAKVQCPSCSLPASRLAAAPMLGVLSLTNGSSMSATSAVPMSRRSCGARLFRGTIGIMSAITVSVR